MGKAFMGIFLSSSAPTVDYSGVTTAVTNAMTALGTNCLSVLTLVLPAGLGLFAAMVIVGYSKRVFSKISGAH